MLVLTRKVGEKIQIGEHISVLIMDVKGRQVRLGIEAPAEIKVHREEIYQKIKDENIQASHIKKAEVDEIIQYFGQKK